MPPAAWNESFKFWYSVLPLFYECIPILVLYLSHMKNFRIKKLGVRESEKTTIHTTTKSSGREQSSLSSLDPIQISPLFDEDEGI